MKLLGEVIRGSGLGLDYFSLPFRSEVGVEVGCDLNAITNGMKAIALKLNPEKNQTILLVLNAVPETSTHFGMSLHPLKKLKFSD